MPPSRELLRVFAPGGSLSAALPSWEPRPQQLEMAAAVEDAIRSARPLLVEAGTGTGKTLAYLSPAILSGKKIVVSTGTRNLQAQILDKDVPLLREALPLPFRVAVLKGISNYLCIRRQREFFALQQASGERSAESDALHAWAETTSTGDRAELPDLPDDAPLWREVQATSDTRIGPRCPHFDECHVTRARRAAQAADVTIVNHHLFFADLALRGRASAAQLLPAYEGVIFDEAHQVEDVATDFLGRSVSSGRIARLARDLRAAVSLGHLDHRLAAIADHVDARADRFFASFVAAVFAATGPSLLREARRTLGPEPLAGAREAYALDTALEEAESALANAHADSDGATAAEGAAQLGRRARALRDDLAFIVDRADRGCVYFAEVRGRSVSLHAAPVDVSGAIRDAVLAETPAAVFTSATLTASGSFDWVRARLGLESATELRVASPFDYARQALLYLPRDLPEPSDPRFTPLAAERVLALVEASGGRAFLLFTSHRQLAAMHKLLAARLGVPVHVQGERPKEVLLDAFRAAPSVLFATASFWEGVDVRGEALELVVIDKLPFAPPDDPLCAARVARVAESGGDGFRDYQVPQAALALAQGFGRLIRSARDRGVVALLDGRATSRGYGRRVLGGLPPDCPRTDDLARTLAFLRALRDPARDRTPGPGEPPADDAR